VRSRTIEFKGNDIFKTLLRHFFIKIFTAFYPRIPKPHEHHYFHFSSRKNKAKGEITQFILDPVTDKKNWKWN